MVIFGRMVVQYFLPYVIKNFPIYGTLWYHPPFITSPLKGKPKVQVVEDHLEHQQEVLQILKGSLVISKNIMKQQAYQPRNERSFEEGDWIFLRLQPYK
jgi:hypothetical protein